MLKENKVKIMSNAFFIACSYKWIIKILFMLRFDNDKVIGIIYPVHVRPVGIIIK